jgi:hypothetical protein
MYISARIQTLRERPTDDVHALIIGAGVGERGALTAALRDIDGIEDVSVLGATTVLCDAPVTRFDDIIELDTTTSIETREPLRLA